MIIILSYLVIMTLVFFFDIFGHKEHEFGMFGVNECYFGVYHHNEKYYSDICSPNLKKKIITITSITVKGYYYDIVITNYYYSDIVIMNYYYSHIFGLFSYYSAIFCSMNIILTPVAMRIFLSA